MYRMIEFSLYNYKSNYAEPFCVRVSVHERESKREGDDKRGKIDSFCVNEKKKDIYLPKTVNHLMLIFLT